MYAKKSAKPAVTVIAILCIAVLGAGFLYVNRLTEEIETYESARSLSHGALLAYKPNPFINSAADARPYTSESGRSDAHYYFNAPEGFTIISHSEPWNDEMLALLYHELKLNAHGSEMEKLNEIIIHPYEDEEMSALATYSPGISTAGFVVAFPAFPADYIVGFPIYTGRINIYGGDTKTTVESIAGSLSHEYGHHYTFYYMFDEEMRKNDLLGSSEYAKLREAEKHDLIASVDLEEDYMQQRFRYMIETAAEDYVTLMGSPTTRQIEMYYDIKQLIDDPELPRDRRGERNAFPQENMSIPLGIDVPGLSDYFYSFTGAEPRVSLEEKQEMKLDISRHSEEFELTTGKRTYEYYTLTWNTPYPNTAYTLACFDPFNYSGWGYPIKTVLPGEQPTQTASAVIGEYAVLRGSTVYSMDDALTDGVMVFYVVAQLQDGTYYLSELYEVNFG